MTHEEVILNPQDDRFPLAIIVRRGFDTDWKTEGTWFLTSSNRDMQLAVHCWPKGHEIQLHAHRLQDRCVRRTMETLFVQSGGPITGDIYYMSNTFNPKPVYVKTVTLYEGDVIHLMHGAHSFRWVGKAQVTESKQGPYYGEEEDKVRF